MIIYQYFTSFCQLFSYFQYIYKGEVSLSKEQLASFLEAAKCLQIKGIKMYYFLLYSSIFHYYIGLNHEEKIPDQVQEETAADEPPPDLIRLSQEEVESAGDDDLDKTMMYEAEENSNQEVLNINLFNQNLIDLEFVLFFPALRYPDGYKSRRIDGRRETD